MEVLSQPYLMSYVDVTLTCTGCSTGDMEVYSSFSNSLGTIYRHRCTVCGRTEELPTSYPRIDVKKVYL